MFKSFISISLLAITVVSGAASADSNKHFDGGFLGGEVGYLSGDGPDGTYYGAFGGFRKQTDSGFVYGVEGTFGTTSVDDYFDESDSEDFYKSQWSTMGTFGYAQGRNLFSLGAGYARVNSSYVYFGTENNVSSDGVAAMASYERALGNNLSLRAHVTTYEFDAYIGTIGLGFRF